MRKELMTRRGGSRDRVLPAYQEKPFLPGTRGSEKVTDTSWREPGKKMKNWF